MALGLSTRLQLSNPGRFLVVTAPMVTDVSSVSYWYFIPVEVLAVLLLEVVALAVSLGLADGCQRERRNLAWASSFSMVGSIAVIRTVGETVSSRTG
jgi:hypothetical protein